MVQLPSQVVLKNKVGQCISTDKEDLEMKVRDVLFKYYKLNNIEVDSHVLKITDIIAKNYRDMEQYLRDSEFVMRSRAVIKYTNQDGEKIVIKTKNSATCYTISTLASILTGDYTGQYFCSVCYSPTVYILLGTDTTTVTYCSMSQLASPINIQPSSTGFYWGTENIGTAPGSGGQVYSYITGTWNPGVLPNGITIGEVGAYNSYLVGPIAGGATYTSYPGAGTFMWARVSSASGAFTAFTYNNTAPITASLKLYMAV